MSNQYLTFDVTKASQVQQLLVGRQGDNQLKFVTMLFWDGERNLPYNLTDKQVVFEALKPDDTHIIDYSGIKIVDASAGLVMYTFNEQVFAVQGLMKQAFFKITHTDGDDVITDSTQEISINILENSVEFGINSENYLSEYDKLISDVEKKFADYSASVQNDIAQAQALHEQIVEYTNLVNSNAVITRGYFGDAALKQPAGDTVVDKLNNEYTNRGVNVKWYGAKGDGLADDTQAFIDAINDAGSSTVIVPDGTYKITKTILIQRNDLVGRNKQNTILKFTGSKKSFLQALYNAKISNLTIDTIDADDGSVGVELGTIYLDGSSNQYAGGHNDILSDLYMVSDPKKLNTIAISLTPKLIKNFDNNTTGVFNNMFENIWIDKFGIGMYIDAQKKGWVNGNTFNKITITGYSKYGVWFGQSDVDGQGLQVNTFNSLQTQRTETTPADAVAVHIQGGTFNSFNDMSHWNDSNYTGTAREDVVALELVPDASGSVYSVSDNKFTGKFEGSVVGDKRILDLNDINVNYLNVENYSKFAQGRMYSSKLDTRMKTNETVSDILDIYQKTPRLSNLVFNSIDGVKYPIVETDDVGKYIKIPKYAGDSIMNIGVFGDEIERFKRSGVLTWSLNIKTTDEASTPNYNDAYGRDVFGNATPLKNYIQMEYVEKIDNNNFVLHLVLDVNSNKDILKNLVKLVLTSAFSISSDNAYVGIREIKTTTRVIKHLADYNDGHVGVPYTKVLANSPQSWDDLGVYPIDPTLFEPWNDQVFKTRNLSNGVYVETVFKV